MSSPEQHLDSVKREALFNGWLLQGGVQWNLSGYELLSEEIVEVGTG